MTGILILGGITAGNRISEAEKGKLYLTNHGVQADDILTEDRSLNTLENLKHARPIINDYIETPVVITNRFHLARCSALAQGMRVKLGLCAAEEELFLSFITMIRILLESYYLHWYEIGKRWSYWTSNKKSLARIS